MPYDIGGYVLAGGRSSRMGRDKALIELAGKPLALRAVEKLRRLCAEVAIAGGCPELAAFAPVVPDIHPGCGPLSGIEAALAHSTREWNLFLPVDMPLVPTAFLERAFVGIALAGSGSAVAVIHTVDGREQPLCAMYHRALLPFLGEALETGRYKVMPVMREAAERIGRGTGVSGCELLRNVSCASGAIQIGDGDLPQRPRAARPTPAQMAARHLWFANANTLEELATISARGDALED